MNENILLLLQIRWCYLVTILMSRYDDSRSRLSQPYRCMWRSCRAPQREVKHNTKTGLVLSTANLLPPDILHSWHIHKLKLVNTLTLTYVFDAQFRDWSHSPSPTSMTHLSRNTPATDDTYSFCPLQKRCMSRRHTDVDVMLRLCVAGRVVFTCASVLWG